MFKSESDAKEYAHKKGLAHFGYALLKIHLQAQSIIQVHGNFQAPILQQVITQKEVDALRERLDVDHQEQALHKKQISHYERLIEHYEQALRGLGKDPSVIKEQIQKASEAPDPVAKKGTLEKRRL